MFPASSVSQLGAVPVMPSTGLKVPRRSSLSTPAMVKQQRGVFSISTLPGKSERNIHSASGHILVETCQQDVNGRAPRMVVGGQDPEGLLARTITIQKQRSQGSEESKDPSKFNLIKRIRGKSDAGSSPFQQPREPVFVMRDAQKDEVEIISARSPTNAPSDFPNLTETKSPLLRKHTVKETSSRPSKSGVASQDFAQPRQDANSAAYRNATKKARKAAANNYTSYGVMSSNEFTPEATAIVQDVIANQQSAERERANSISIHSAPSRRGSIFDKVTELVKPNSKPRPMSWDPAHTSGRQHGADTVERRGSLWSRVGGTVKWKHGKEESGEENGNEGVRKDGVVLNSVKWEKE